AMFFDNKAGSCYMFDQIGSFNNPKNGASIKSYIKVYEIQSDVSQGHKNKKQPTKVVIIVVVTVLVALFVILGLVIRGLRYYKKKKKYESSEEDTFLENISGMPVRFTYKNLQEATNGFTTKLDQGGFGSVYQGVLKDGT
ncbi:hypothetical protein Tco_1239947, partial [Tanacetum coccineum]